MGKVDFYLFALVFFGHLYFFVKKKKLFKHLLSRYDNDSQKETRASRRKIKINYLCSYFLISCPSETNVK